MVNIDRDNVICIVTELFGNVIREADITVWTLSQIITVAPDAAVLVYTVKTDADLPAPPALIRLYMKPVPADTAGQIACSAGTIPVKRQCNRPVMRKCHFLPACIIIPCLPGIRLISQMKPAVVR